MKEEFFGLCFNCGSVEFMELFEDLSDTEGKPRINSLNHSGLTTHKTSKDITKMVYKDVICTRCEAPMVLIPFTLFNLNERMKIFKMSREERIKVAERFLVADELNRELEK